MTGWCDTCGHKITYHGDRAVGGVCAHGRGYPDVCGCPNYREDTNGPALGAA